MSTHSRAYQNIDRVYPMTRSTEPKMGKARGSLPWPDAVTVALRERCKCSLLQVLNCGKPVAGRGSRAPQMRLSGEAEMMQVPFDAPSED